MAGAAGSLVPRAGRADARKVFNPLQHRKPARKVSEMMQEYRANSYLFGGNAPYVEELYEAYLDNPGSVPDNWRTYFDALQNVPADRRLERPRRGARAGRRIVRAARQGQRLRQQGLERRPGDRAQAGPRPVADRGLSLARLALGRPRPAEAPGAAEDSRARAGVLRPHRGRHGHGVQRHEHLLHDRRAHDAARDRAGAARDLLRHDRRRVHAHHRADREALVAAAARVDPLQAELQRRREDPHPRSPDRRRRPGALPAHQVRRPEALLARRRRELHRLDGRVRAARRRQGRAGDRHRHGAPRPPQRARQHARQDAEGPVRRVRPHRAREPALGRRQVPPGLLERHHDRRAARCT